MLPSHFQEKDSDWWSLRKSSITKIKETSYIKQILFVLLNFMFNDLQFYICVRLEVL